MEDSVLGIITDSHRAEHLACGVLLLGLVV